MELVLGLAALATVISGVAGAGHYDNTGPEIVEAEPKTVQTANGEYFQHDAPEIAESHLSEFQGALSGIPQKSRPIDRWEHYYNEIESNNSFITANEVGIYNYDFSTYQSGDTPTSYWKSIKGSIEQTEDVDYYKFTLYGKASVSISLSEIPSQCDYDLKLFEEGTGNNGDGLLIKQIGSSTFGSNSDEQIEKTLYPNTYYIKVYSYRGYGSPLYSLWLNISYQRNNERITAMKATGATGALWHSDYDPYGIQPSITDSRTLVGSKGNWWKQTGPRDWQSGSWNTTHFTFPIETGEYKHAEIFIWDETFRRQMLSLVTRLYDAISDQIQREVEFRLIKQVVYYQWGGVVTILGYAPYIGTAISLISDAYDLISGAADILCPSEDVLVTKGNYLEYLSRLEAALDMYRALPDSDITAFKIPIRYKIVKKTNEAAPASVNMAIGASYNCTNYYLTYQPSDPRQFFGYYEDTIYAQDPENPITGTIFPIVDGDSMHKALSRESYDMSCATINVNTQSSSFSLSAGNYKWFKFTAPRRAYYRFVSQGDTEATLDVFDSMVYGKSEYLMKKRLYQNNGLLSGFLYSVSLEEGQTLYFRVSGGDGDYIQLSSTKFAVYDHALTSILSIYADELNLSMNWGDPVLPVTQSLNEKGLRVVAKENARINEDWLLELEADCLDDFFRASVTIQFDRPIKRIAMDMAYGTWWRYSRNPLIINGLNSSGQTVITYWEDTMDYDFFPNYHTYSYLLKDPSQGVYDDIYSIQLMLDPYQTQDSYHSSYEMVQIGMFVIEYAD